MIEIHCRKAICRYRCIYTDIKRFCRCWKFRWLICSSVGDMCAILSRTIIVDLCLKRKNRHENFLLVWPLSTVSIRLYGFQLIWYGILSLYDLYQHQVLAGTCVNFSTVRRYRYRNTSRKNLSSMVTVISTNHRLTFLWCKFRVF